MWSELLEPAASDFQPLNNSMQKIVHSLLASSLFVGGAVSSQAENFTWNPPVGGSGGSVSWNNALNWGGTAPANNITDDIAVFNSTSAYNFQPTLDAFTVQSVRGLQLGGTSTVALTLGAGAGTKTTGLASTSGATSLVLADVTNLAVGQNITGSGIGVGTFITGIDVGTNTITLSRSTTGNTALGSTLTVNSSLRLGAGGLNLGAGTPNVSNIISAPVVLGANQAWNNDSVRSLQIQGSIFLDGYTLTLTGTTGSTISFNGANTTQSIAGSGSIVVDTQGTVSFGPGSGGRQMNTFTGGVTLNSGTIALQGGNSGGGGGMGGLGTGIFTINGGAVSGGGNIAGRALTISGQVWNADWSFVGSRSVDMGTGAISLGTAAGTSRTLTVQAGANILTIGGAISNGATANSLVKAGSSTLILSGTSVYTGQTLVNAGTLIVDGALDGGGDVIVMAGAALGGSGSIAGNATISGTHRPGNSPGVQTFENDLAYNAGAQFEFELTANSSVQGSPVAVFDQIVVGGDLNFTGETLFSMTFNAGSSVDWSDSFWNTNQSWLVFDVAGLTTGLDNLSVVFANWADGQGDLFDTVRAGAAFSFSQTGGDVYLNYVAIPEPSTGLLLAGGFVTVALFRRRRR